MTLPNAYGPGFIELSPPFLVAADLANETGWVPVAGLEVIYDVDNRGFVFTTTGRGFLFDKERPERIMWEVETGSPGEGRFAMIHPNRLEIMGFDWLSTAVA